MGGKPNNAPPPPHGKNGMAPTWREKTAHIEKIPPKGKLPPSHMDFFIHAPPPGERLHPPLAGADHDLHSLYSVCLRELEKKKKKFNKNKNFLALLFNFLGGGGVSIVYMPYACVAICMCCHIHVLPYACVAI